MTLKKDANPIKIYSPMEGRTSIELGRINARLGKRHKIKIITAIPMTNGNIPLNILAMGTSLAIPAMTKTLTPTGGVICPISIIITMITPNQIGLKPKATTVGYIMGRVIMTMGIIFITIPRMR